jgi:hypothetical protein
MDIDTILRIKGGPGHTRLLNLTGSRSAQATDMPGRGAAIFYASNFLFSKRLTDRLLARAGAAMSSDSHVVYGRTTPVSDQI